MRPTAAGGLLILHPEETPPQGSAPSRKHVLSEQPLMSLTPRHREGCLWEDTLNVSQMTCRANALWLGEDPGCVHRANENDQPVFLLHCPDSEALSTLKFHSSQAAEDLFGKIS